MQAGLTLSKGGFSKRGSVCNTNDDVRGGYVKLNVTHALNFTLPVLYSVQCTNIIVMILDMDSKP